MKKRERGWRHAGVDFIDMDPLKTNIPLYIYIAIDHAGSIS